MLSEDTVKKFFQYMSGRDDEKLEQMLDDDAVFFFPKTNTIKGKKRIISFFRVLWRQYPELVFNVGRVIISDNHAAASWENTGKSRDGIDYMNAGVTIMEMHNDKIIFISDYFKDTGKF